MKVGAVEAPELARIGQEKKGQVSSSREEAGQEAARKQPEKGETTSILGREMSQEDTERMMEVINNAMEIFDYNLQFKLHRETNRVIVKVVEAGSDKVIREIPPESMLDLMVKFRDMLGMFVDKKV